MTSRILVPLRSSDRIEYVLPYVEKIAQPGMKVVFLVHCAVHRFERFLDLLLSINTGIQPEFLPKSRSAEYAEEKWKEPVEKGVSLACEGLSRLGVKVEVGVYTGPFKKTVREYACNGNAQLIVMPGIRATQPVRILRKLLAFDRSFMSPSLPPALLLDPGNTVHR